MIELLTLKGMVRTTEERCKDIGAIGRVILTTNGFIIEITKDHVRAQRIIDMKQLASTYDPKGVIEDAVTFAISRLEEAV